MIFGLISANEQWALHAYFNFAIDDDPPSDLALLAHRDRVTDDQPSLPQRAGRAWAHFCRALDQDELQRAAVAERKRTIGSERHMTLRAVVRPEPDIDSPAKAVIHQAINSLRAEKCESPELRDLERHLQKHPFKSDETDDHRDPPAA